MRLLLLKNKFLTSIGHSYCVGTNPGNFGNPEAIFYYNLFDSLLLYLFIKLFFFSFFFFIYLFYY